MSRHPNESANVRVDSRTASQAPPSPIAPDVAPAPQAAGLDAARLAAAEEMLRAQVERGRRPGAVMLVAPGQRVEIQPLFRTMVYSALGD